jgi:hypothetical protein
MLMNMFGVKVGKELMADDVTTVWDGNDIL